LGQSSPTLSGGEAQRIKLSRELAKVGTGRTLYILDEPTTGLHFDDIKKLLKVLARLVDAGNTVLVIEHNLDVIKTADWIIDLGPDGGRRGGTLVAEGTPEEVAANPASYTGQFLAEILEGRAAKPSAKQQAAAVNNAPVAKKSAAKKTAAKKSAPAKKVASATKTAATKKTAARKRVAG
ncbi:MAG TPA: excinuclease ABC subunit A, partial [Kribbella sp.]